VSPLIIPVEYIIILEYNYYRITFIILYKEGSSIMDDMELKIIKQAIINEVEGYEFYKMAAAKAPTVDSRRAFMEIAEEELKHITWLREMFVAIKNEASDEFNIANVVEAHSPNLFNWKNIDRETAQIAVSVFGIGIQMERAAVEFYKKASEESNITEAKDLYKILTAWEQVHMSEFSNQYEKLKEEWWNDQEYAPF
jgi:rubrerythrin